MFAKFLFFFLAFFIFVNAAPFSYPTLESTERGTSVNPTPTQGTGYYNDPFGLEQRELLGTGATTADDIDRLPGRDLFGLPGGDSLSVDPEPYSSFNEDPDLGKRDSANFFKKIWYGLSGKPRRELHSELEKRGLYTNIKSFWDSLTKNNGRELHRDGDLGNGAP